MNGYLESRRRVAYAEQTHKMALDLYDSVFPPWRWGRYVKQYREVRRRIKLQRSWLPLT